MRSKSAFLIVALAVLFTCSAHAQTPALIPLTVPPASVCAQGAQNFGAIASYLNNGNFYKATVLAPAISASTTYTEFEYFLGQALALDQQQMAFLKSCQFSVPVFCKPGTQKLADTTPAGVGSLLQSFDANEGLSAIQGLFSVPAPPANFNPTTALNNFYTVTEGSYCLFYPYSVHPDVVKGINPPKLS